MTMGISLPASTNDDDMIVDVAIEVQATLLHFARRMKFVVVSYATTGRPSEPMAIDRPPPIVCESIVDVA